MCQKKLFLIFLFALSMAFIPASPLHASSSPYFYGSIGEIAGSKAVISFNSLLPEKIYFICDISKATCEKQGSTTPELVRLDKDVKEKNYFLNSQKDKIFVSETVAGRNGTIIQNALYSVHDGKIVLESVLPTHERVSRGFFSGDEARLILVTRDNYLVSLNTQTKKVVFKEPFKDKLKATRITLSPNGKFLAYYIPAYEKTKMRTFKLWDLAQNKIYEWQGAVAYWDLLSEDLNLFQFSSDTSMLLYLDDKEDVPTLYKIDLKDFSKISVPGKRIVTESYSISDFIFADSATLYFTANRENSLIWSLYRLDLKNNDLLKIRDGISYAQTMKLIGADLLYLHTESNGIHPEILSTITGKVSSLPTVPKKEAESISQEVMSSEKVKGVLLYPKDYDPNKMYPLLVWLHGGPYRQTSPGYHPFWGYAGYDAILKEAQKNGALVFKVDYRGSYGYGRVFAESIRDAIGKGDVEDVLNAISYAQSIAKINRVYVVGNSYGGYLSLRSIVEKPKEIDAVISINGVTDWKMLLADLRNSIFNIFFDDPFKKEKLYAQASILSRLDNLTDQKIVLVKGQEDSTIPQKQTDLLYDALIAKHKNVEQVAYADENHAIEKEENLKDLCRHLFRVMKLRLRRGACSLN